MAEYKNGVNAFGNMSVSKEDRSAEVKTGRAVFVDEDKYANDADYKLKVDKCLAEGFHRVSEGSEGGGSSDFSTASVTIINNDNMAFESMVVYLQYEPFFDKTSLEYFVNVSAGETAVLEVVLYKGENGMDVSGHGVSGSGNVSIDGIEATITGDCTITISE